MADELIKNVTSIFILFLLFVVFYSIFKKQSFMESLKEIKDNMIDLFGGEE